LPETAHHVAAGDRLQLAVLVQQVGAEQRSLRFLEQQARISRSEPHSSDSKWLKLIHRSAAGSISVATASRTAGNSQRIPVW
jgi:hypothetical protein